MLRFTSFRPTLACTTPDARRVLKAKLLSQAFANTHVVVCHIFASAQDFRWSQCRTVHSYVLAWYHRQTNRSGSIGLMDIHRGNLHQGQHQWRLISKFHEFVFGATSQPLLQISWTQLFSARISTLLFLLCCISLGYYKKGLVHSIGTPASCEGCQTHNICLTVKWLTLWMSVEPQPLHDIVVCCLALPRILKNIQEGW